MYTIVPRVRGLVLDDIFLDDQNPAYTKEVSPDAYEAWIKGLISIYPSPNPSITPPTTPGTPTPPTGGGSGGEPPPGGGSGGGPGGGTPPPGGGATPTPSQPSHQYVVFDLLTKPKTSVKLSPTTPCVNIGYTQTIR